MIKLTRVAAHGDGALLLFFSDGTSGVWSALPLVQRNTVLTRPLADTDYLARAFIEGGALAWPNGLELSPAALHAQLAAAGALRRAAA